MEGWQVQHEVPVAGLAVAALAVPVFNLDESPPRQLLERTPCDVLGTAAVLCDDAGQQTFSDRQYTRCSYTPSAAPG